MTDADGSAERQKAGAGNGEARSGERFVKQLPVLVEQSQKFLDEIERLSGMPVNIYWNAWNGNIRPNDVLALY